MKSLLSSINLYTNIHYSVNKIFRQLEMGLDVREKENVQERKRRMRKVRKQEEREG